MAKSLLSELVIKISVKLDSSFNANLKNTKKQVEELSDVLSDEPTPSKDFINIKFFYHPAVPMPKVLIDGKEEWIEEMILTARTGEGMEITMMSHKFEEYPFIKVNQSKGKVKAVEWHLKYEVS